MAVMGLVSYEFGGVFFNATCALKVLQVVVDVKNKKISHDRTVGLLEDVARIGWAEPWRHVLSRPLWVPPGCGAFLGTSLVPKVCDCH